ncbi:hypothetical protein [Bradyrhizobium sp. HKCCYLS3013]|uniref:hypothetical protein n=1 Tax=Bradyrhizobium sp. HKCCYLS3013 TaxID=3420735 RepID=UPI003EBEBC17
MKLPKLWSESIADLERFANALNRVSQTADLASGLLGSLGSIRSQASELRTEEKTRRKYRAIRFPELVIVPPIERQLHPARTKLEGAFLQLVYECYEKVEVVSRLGVEHLDRIRRADFQVCVRGTVTFGSASVAVEDHWRVDTHYFQEESTEPHPWFHYQRGGHAQDRFAETTGFLPGDCLEAAKFQEGINLCALMQTAPPRVPMPPMDPICAINFVIAQHDGITWKKLWSIPEYDGVVRKAQEKLWKPYFDMVAQGEHRKRLMPFFGAPSPTTFA